jgi:hypothetical protein
MAVVAALPSRPIDVTKLNAMSAENELSRRNSAARIRNQR